MPLNKIFSFLPFLLLHFFSLTVFSQRLHKESSWLYEAGETKPKIQTELIYDKKGNVLQDHDYPGICHVITKYDKKNRPVEIGIGCGENDETEYFRYSKNGRIWIDHQGNGETRELYDSLDEKGKIIFTKEVLYKYSAKRGENEDDITLKTNTYDGKGNLLFSLSRRSLWEEEKNIKSTVTKKYEYNKNGQILSHIARDSATKKILSWERRNYFSSGKLSSHAYSTSMWDLKHDSVFFEYDIYGRLLKHVMYDNIDTVGNYWSVETLLISYLSDKPSPHFKKNIAFIGQPKQIETTDPDMLHGLDSLFSEPKEMIRTLLHPSRPDAKDWDESYFSSYKYDSIGRLKSVSFETSNKERKEKQFDVYEYDKTGRVLSILSEIPKHPERRRFKKNTYEAAGNLKTTISEEGTDSLKTENFYKAGKLCQELFFKNKMLRKENIYTNGKILQTKNYGEKGVLLEKIIWRRTYFK